MTTTLVPALGHGPLTQQGTGATPGYDAIDARRWTSGPSLGEGVTTYGSFRVSQRAAGANLSVDINMDDFAYVRGDAVTLQGLYQISPHASTINETISTADATNPRIDRVILEIKDTQHDASGSSLAQTRVVTGTPTGGATLDNLTGAGAVPSSALLLADVLVAATDTAISNAEIRDRRAFVSGVPSILTAVDMVAPTSPLPLSVTLDSSTTTGDITFTNHDTDQVAGLIYIPRRIASATRLRWKYVQGATALAGSYVFAVFDASGRKIIDTGSVAFAGAINTWRSESVTITATTFEAGWYYGFFGSDTTVGGVGTPGWGVLATVSGNIVAAAAGPNMFLGATGGGLTVPTTLVSFTDMGTSTSPTIVPRLPQFTLSVG
jgi:hypothetical protein